MIHTVPWGLRLPPPSGGETGLARGHLEVSNILEPRRLSSLPHTRKSKILLSRGCTSASPLFTRGLPEEVVSHSQVRDGSFQ